MDFWGRSIRGYCFQRDHFGMCFQRDFGMCFQRDFGMCFERDFGIVFLREWDDGRLVLLELSKRTIILLKRNSLRMAIPTKNQVFKRKWLASHQGPSLPPLVHPHLTLVLLRFAKLSPMKNPNQNEAAIWKVELTTVNLNQTTLRIPRWLN